MAKSKKAGPHMESEKEEKGWVLAGGTQQITSGPGKGKRQNFGPEGVPSNFGARAGRRKTGGKKSVGAKKTAKPTPKFKKGSGKSAVKAKLAARAAAKKAGKGK